MSARIFLFFKFNGVVLEVCLPIRKRMTNNQSETENWSLLQVLLPTSWTNIHIESSWHLSGKLEHLHVCWTLSQLTQDLSCRCKSKWQKYEAFQHLKIQTQDSYTLFLMVSLMPLSAYRKCPLWLAPLQSQELPILTREFPVDTFQRTLQILCIFLSRQLTPKLAFSLRATSMK